MVCSFLGSIGTQVSGLKVIGALLFLLFHVCYLRAVNQFVTCLPFFYVILRVINQFVILFTVFFYVILKDVN